MTRLRFAHEVLFVESGEDRQILDWEPRLFFTVAGYQLDEVQGCYSFSDRRHVLEVLRETIEYLTDEGFAYEVDDEVRKLLARLHDQQDQYKGALEAGLQALHVVAQPVDTYSNMLARELKPYQLRGVQHLLAVKHGANFSVPGSGKTTVIYAAFEFLRRERIVDKLLVIGPRSCFLPWEEEFKACFGYPARSARLTGAARYSLYIDSDNYDVFLCTYQTASNDVNELIRLCRMHKTLVVIDESHNIKKLQGGVWSDATLQIAPYATRRAILSGTPMPNSYADLWTQITFLWPGKQVLGDRVPYRHRCEDETEHTSIRRAIRPFFVRVTKSELGLPQPRFERIYCDLKSYQESIYRALSVKFLKELDTPPEDHWMLRQWRKAKMVRLIQVASNPALLTQYSEEFDIPPFSGEGASVIQLIDEYPKYETPAKIERAIQLVRELLDQGEKVVVWTCFVHNIKMLERLLQGVDLFIVYGAVPRDENEDIEFNREQQLQQFKEIDRPAVLLANPAACAESISLHKACHHAIYLERTFNCGQYLQSLDRIHRIGLRPDEIVTYHILVANGTIDETIDRRLGEKQADMIHLIEDELPVGTLEVELHQLGFSESEEAIDFREAVKDIRRRLEPSGSARSA
jgi:SNF2 family DNA or RNA helicase